MKYTIIIINILLISITAKSQDLNGYREIINLDDEFELFNSNLNELSFVDLSKFWLNNPSERRLGFIGDKFQRLKIKFISIDKSISNKNKYVVYGKSNVSGNICEFNGILIVKESYYIKSLNFPEGNTGILAGEYRFSENKNQNNSGVFKGRFITYWYKNEKGEFKYNNLLGTSASYNNNQFSGIWSQYGKQDKKQANWGDNRIPLSGDLDIGTSEFRPSDKYVSNGWFTFILANGASPNRMNIEAFRKSETEEWWNKDLNINIKNLIGSYGEDKITKNAYISIYKDKIYYPDPNIWLKYKLKKDTIITINDKSHTNKFLILKLTADSLILHNINYEIRIPLNRRVE